MINEGNMEQVNAVLRAEVMRLRSENNRLFWDKLYWKGLFWLSLTIAVFVIGWLAIALGGTP